MANDQERRAELDRRNDERNKQSQQDARAKRG